MDYTTTDIASLGAKLDELDLTGAERSILDAILARADDTVGHRGGGFGLKIGNLLDTLSNPNPYFDGSGSHVASEPISNGDLGSGRRESILATDPGSGR